MFDCSETHKLFVALRCFQYENYFYVEILFNPEILTFITNNNILIHKSQLTLHYDEI